MRSIAIVALLALLIMPCIAVQDSVTTGPYKVTFDLGIPKEAYYKIKTIDPKMTETLRGDKPTEYQINIFGAAGTNKFMLIKIIYSEKPSPFLSGSDLELILKSRDASISKFESGIRIIDGANGAIASGVPIADSETPLDTYHALYEPLFDPTRILVEIYSQFPWEEGTLSLLKTIHVEKINATT